MIRYPAQLVDQARKLADKGFTYRKIGTLTNGDPELVATFIGLFRESYHLDETKLRVHMQVHSNQNYSNLVDFWSGLLRISPGKFLKPVITEAGGNKHRSSYLGTCTVKYYNYELQLKLIGISEEYMRKFAILEGIPNGSGDGSLNHIA